MWVKSIELLNVKSYVQATIDLSENVNLLIGANNAGKSSIIKSLLNLQYRAFEGKDIRANEIASKLITKIVDVDENDNLAFYDQKHHNEFVRLKSATILWMLARNGQQEEYLYADSKHKFKRVALNRFEITDKKGDKVSYKAFPRFPDSENQNNFIYPFLAKRKTEYYDGNINQELSFRVHEGLRNLAAKIQKIGNASHPMNNEFTSLCDDILGFRIGVIPMDQSTGGQEPGIYASHTSIIPLRGMGDGVANIVGFIATLLTEDRKLYLIEELENDIHPKALKKLLELIKRKSTNNQFVISTHSHIVLKYLGIIPKTKIFYIDWKPKTDASNIPTSSVTEIENTPEVRIDILEKLGYDFHDFELYQAYLILEESSAESIIRDFLIPNFVPNLYQKLKTIAARGVDDLKARVIDFNRLFVFIHTSPVYNGKAWVIADGDDAERNCIEDLKRNFKTWPNDHFISLSKKNFEEYYPSKFQKRVVNALKANGAEKREAKRKLVSDVMQWALNNREEAIKEFAVSSADVIAILKDIDAKIKK